MCVSDVESVVRALLAAIDDLVAERVREATGRGGPAGPPERLVSHHEWEAAPAGETPAERRRRLRRWSDRARAGGVPGARRRGRTWYLPASALAAYMASERVTHPETAAERKYRAAWERKRAKRAERKRPALAADRRGGAVGCD